MTTKMFKALNANKTSVLALAAGLAIAAAPMAALAQTSLGSTGGLGVNAAVGNGIQQSQPVIQANTGSSSPVVGVGALSGQPNHSGSLATVSVLNTQRLLGAQLGSSANAPNVSVNNSTHQPVLSGLSH